MNLDKSKWSVAISLVLIAFSFPLFAGNTGKIAGVVKDEVSGDQLIGVNVLLEGTSLGASTDADGYFYIIGVPLGSQTVVFQYVGYRTLSVTKVFIQADLTNRLNVEMLPASVETSPVDVVAQREIVQKDVTSTRRITTSEDIVNTPGIESITEVLTLMPGVTLDALPERLSLADGSQLQVRDESLKNIHVRGGRGGEILFVVDGLPVNHPIYGGRAVLDLNVEDVQQIEMLTGAFNAEYGQAQSGVVNVTTRSGSAKFIGGLEYKTDITGDLGHSQNAEYASVFSGGPLKPMKKLGIGKFFYFFSGNVSMSDTPFQNRRNRDLLSILNAFDVNEKQDNTVNLNSKLTWQLTNSSNLVFSYHGSVKNWTNFEWLFQDIPDNAAEYNRNTQNVNIRYQRTFSKSTFMNLNLGYLDVKFNGSIDGETSPDQFWKISPDTMFTTAKPPQIDPRTRFFADGEQAIWRDDHTKSFTFKGEVTSQIHKNHLLKTGGSIQYHDLQYVDINDAAYKLSAYGEFVFNDGPEVSRPPGPFPEFGRTRWAFTNFPLIGDFYIQDKFELQSLILNIGARLDWVNLGKRLNGQGYKAAWEAATGIPSDWSLNKFEISPRFGVSFPISERMVLFFSYGHFNQLPELQFFYRDPWSGGFTGNPHLEFENTILFEFGLTRQISDFWSVDVKAYGKDISNVVDTEGLQAALGVPVQLYVNSGFGRSRGLEIELNKFYSGFTQLNLGYTLQWANGFSSSPFDGFIRDQNNLARPIRERPLDWDIRHQFILNTSLISSKGRHLNLFGLKLPDNWNISLLTRFASGRPFTPGTLDPLEARVRENGESQPYNISTDLKINKSFDTGFGSISVFMDAFSLFNRRNDVNVNPWTGEAIRYGDTNSGTNEIYSWSQMNALLTPQWWTPPRYVQFGLRFNY